MGALCAVVRTDSESAGEADDRGGSEAAKGRTPQAPTPNPPIRSPLNPWLCSRACDGACLLHLFTSQQWIGGPPKDNN
eukprot:1251740-Alexandrium_andersonii.AAC.1